MLIIIIDNNDVIRRIMAHVFLLDYVFSFSLVFFIHHVNNCRICFFFFFCDRLPEIKFEIYLKIEQNVLKMYFTVQINQDNQWY